MYVRQLLDTLGYMSNDPDANVRSALTELVTLRKLVQDYAQKEKAIDLYESGSIQHMDALQLAQSASNRLMAAVGEAETRDHLATDYEQAKSIYG